MDAQELVETYEWKLFVSLLPAGCMDEEVLRQHGALVRKREVRSGADLLRLVMAYSVCDMTLRGAAAWAETKGLGKLSHTAVRKRLASAGSWLRWVVQQLLVGRHGPAASTSPPARILDASVVNGPGATGTEWRVHLGMDLASETIQSVEVTGPEGGEKFGRHAVEPGEVLMGDRGYGQRAGVAYVLSHDAHVLVRLNWKNFPLEDADGAPINILGLTESLQVDERGDWDVWFRDRGDRYRVRLVALRTAAEPDPKKGQRIKRRAQRSQRRIDPRTLQASCFLFLLTDLPREKLPADLVLDLYRLRWRIETGFKRLKGVLNLDGLRAHDPDVVTTYLCAKLIAAIVLDRLEESAEASPWNTAEDDGGSPAEGPSALPPCEERYAMTVA